MVEKAQHGTAAWTVAAAAGGNEVAVVVAVVDAAAAVVVVVAVGVLRTLEIDLPVQY